MTAESRTSDRNVFVTAQHALALIAVGSLFVPARRYPVLFSMSEAEIRVQDLLLFAFVLAVVFGPAGTRHAVRRAMVTWPACFAGAFFLLVVLSLAQVPAAEFAAAAVAAGKLIEFSIAGALAGVVLMSAGRFPAFVAVLALGVAINTAFSVWRGIEERAVDFVSARPGGFLGPEILATGGAVTAVAGFGLVGLAGRDRRIAIGAMVAGSLAILAGRSILAAGALFVGLAALFLVLRQRLAAVAITISLALLAVVLAARHSDVAGVTRLLDSPAAGAVPEDREVFVPAVNHLLNGGCEAGTEGWSTNGANTSVDASRNRRRFGAASCRVRTPGAIPGEGVFHHDVPVLPAGTYSLSAWILAPRNATISLGIEWLGTERQFLRASAISQPGTGEWQRGSLTRTSPRNVGSIRVTIYSQQPGKAIIFNVDGIQLQEGVPTPYSSSRQEPSLNLAVNDGCEVSTTGWNSNPSRVSVIRDAARRRLGSGACLVSTPGRSRGEGIFHERIRVSGGAPYSFTSWVRARPRTRVALRIEWLAENGRVLSVTSASAAGNGVWRFRRLMNIRAPEASAWARPTIYAAGPPRKTSFHVDGTFFGVWRSPSEASYATGSLTHRILVSYIGARVAVDNPLTGVGWTRGSRQEVMADAIYEREARRLFPNIDPALYPSRFPTHSHSAYIQTAADAGFAALLALLSMTVASLVWAVRAARPRRDEWRAYAGAVAAMIVAIAFWFNSTPLFGGSLEVGLFWCLAGMAASLYGGPLVRRARSGREMDQR